MNKAKEEAIRMTLNGLWAIVANWDNLRLRRKRTIWVV